MSRKDNLRKMNIDDIFDEHDVEVRDGEPTILIPKSSLYSVSQVRKKFEPDSIKELRLNMEKYGQRQPVRVGKMDSQGYLIQEGERRWRAIMESELITHVICIIGNGNLLTQVSENLLREDLSPFEEGNAFALIKTEHNISKNKDVAELLGISEARVSAAIKATMAPELIVNAFENDKIGDVDTINSLRIAFELNPTRTEDLLKKSENVSRKEAQEFTRLIKSENKKEKSSSSSKRISSEKKSDSSINNDSRTIKKKTNENIKGVRVRLNGELGIIDMTGHQFQAGTIVVQLDNASSKVTAPASDVELIGYYVE